MARFYHKVWLYWRIGECEGTSDVGRLYSECQKEYGCGSVNECTEWNKQMFSLYPQLPSILCHITFDSAGLFRSIYHIVRFIEKVTIPKNEAELILIKRALNSTWGYNHESKQLCISTHCLPLYIRKFHSLCKLPSAAVSLDKVLWARSVRSEDSLLPCIRALTDSLYRQRCPKLSWWVIRPLSDNLALQTPYQVPSTLMQAKWKWLLFNGETSNLTLNSNSTYAWVTEVIVQQSSVLAPERSIMLTMVSVSGI